MTSLQFANLHAYFTKTMNASLEEPMKWVNKQDLWVRGQCHKNAGISAPRGKASSSSDDIVEEDDVVFDSDGIYDHHSSPSGDQSDIKDVKRRVWVAACLTLRQFDGIVAGYQARYETSRRRSESAASEGNGMHEDHSTRDPKQRIPKMTYQDFLFLQSNADLYDVIDMYDPSQR